VKRSPYVWWAAIAVVIGGAAFVGCRQQTTTQTPDQPITRTVHVGYWGGTCEAPIYIAKENGIYKKNGLNVELVQLSPTVFKEGITTGKIDAVQTTPDNFKAIADGFDMVLTDGVHTGCIQAVAANNSGINTIADLKGKIVGTDSMGGVPMTLLSMELLKAGIDPKKDVEWKVYPGPQLSLAMAKKEVDAFATWDPFPQMAINDGKATLFFSNTASYPYADQYCCFVGINGKVAREEPKVARALTASFAEADQWIAANPQRAAQISVDMKYTSGDAQLNGDLLAKYKWYPNDEKRATDSYRYFLKGMVDLKMLDPSTDVDALIQKTFIYMGAQKKPSKG
jgi:NitT/TauT family transport system substrate-binding protein